MGKKSNPIKDILDTTVKAIADTGSEIGKVAGGDININPFVKQEEEAKNEARKDAAQRSAASAAQKQSEQDQLKVKSANASASKGSSIILGNQKKKKKGGSVSSGMGLSTGSTGLQT